MWGHEHECLINTRESAAGTFRVTQPGSSVATSLVEGESQAKHIGLLQVRGEAYKLAPIPLAQVRPFVVDEVALAPGGTARQALGGVGVVEQGAGRAGPGRDGGGGE